MPHTELFQKEMKTLAIIPSRYGSTRFPGKPLALLGGKPVVQWVYEAASKAADRAVVATDDLRIKQCVEAFGGEALLTSPHHTSGTSRICEAYVQLHDQADVIINVQGDEPLITAEHIRLLTTCFEDERTQIATLATQIQTTEQLFDCNQVKVVLDARGNALYFSRAAVPYLRDKAKDRWIDTATYYGHIGIYAFRSDVLGKISSLPPSPLEKAENLEQLRWLYHGYTIRCALISDTLVGIDTPEDLERAEKLVIAQG